MAEPMTCAQAEALLGVAALGALDAPDLPKLETHLADCDPCHRRGAQYANLVAMLPAALDPVAPPPDLRRRLMAQVYAEAMGPVPKAWWRRVFDAIPASRGLTAAGALVAVAAVAVLVWSTVSRVSSAPSVAYTIAGTTAQPDATGSLIADPAASTAVLTVHDLAAPMPAGSVYEVWLLTASGASTPIAFLSLTPGGRDWTAVVPGSLSGYRNIAATVEPAGGSPAPTGTEVFSGQLGGS